MELGGIVSYLVFFLVNAGIYAVLTLGLNVQWGYSGLFNVGVAGFWAIGAYTSAVLTTAPSPDHLGGLGLPFLVGVAGAALASAAAAWLIGRLTLRLRGDYLAIATLGVAESIRLVLTNQDDWTGGVRGIAGIPRPLQGLAPIDYNWLYLLLVALFVAILYALLERSVRSPWGRVLKAIREDEQVPAALGKDTFQFRLEALVLGAAVMGVGGSLYAHFVAFISPDAFDPMQGTFLVWVMLIVGGSGNNKGAILGAVTVWAIWALTEFLTGLLPGSLATQAAALRIILIGVLLLAVLLARPRGLLGEERVVSRFATAGTPTPRTGRAAHTTPAGASEAASGSGGGPSGAA